MLNGNCWTEPVENSWILKLASTILKRVAGERGKKLVAEVLITFVGYKVVTYICSKWFYKYKTRNWWFHVFTQIQLMQSYKKVTFCLNYVCFLYLSTNKSLFVNNCPYFILNKCQIYKQKYCEQRFCFSL